MTDLSESRKTIEKGLSHASAGNNVNIGFFKLLFVVKNPIGNIFLVFGILLLIAYSIFNLISEIFYGICINLIERKRMEELKIYCLTLGLSGIAYFLLYMLAGVFFNKHSEYLSKNFKAKYYSLVFKQDFEWFNTQESSKLSESIKNSYLKLQSGVIKPQFF